MSKTDTQTPTLFDLEGPPSAVAKKKPKKAAKKAPKKAAKKAPKKAAKRAPKKAGSKKAGSKKTSTSGAARRSSGTKKSAAAGERKRVGAEAMAAKQKEISVSEFFTKNRHLLGFDSPLKALLTAVKEAVDNSLDACEEAGILPEVIVELTPTSDKTFRMSVEDNGPGIVEAQVGKVFGKLLYGSKFHKLSQSRGQQGIGISAAGMYGQLTTGKPVRIISRTSRRKAAMEFSLTIDTLRNRPEIHSSEAVEWERAHGTRVEIEMEARYQKGLRSVDMYLKQTAIANPHLTLTFIDPGGDRVTYERNSKELPPETVEIQPHPHGVELGRLIGMLKETSCRSLSGFLREEFTRVGPGVAKKIVDAAGKGLTLKSYPSRIAREQAAALHDAIQNTKISAPSTDCIAPIGEELIVAGLKKELEADFYVARSRPPAVYRGNPFQIEVGIAFGKPGGFGLEMTEDKRIRKKQKAKVATEELVGAADEPIRVLRYANRVPLLHQQSGCAITKGVIQTAWRNYGLSQARGALPVGPMAVMVHIASVWVPFTSESKEAIASYDEILKEIKLGLQDCGRKLGAYISKGKRMRREFEKRSHIEKYIPHIGEALQEILTLTDKQKTETVETLEDVLHRSRKF